MTDTQFTNHPPMVVKLPEAAPEVRDYLSSAERATGLDRSTLITALLMEGIAKSRNNQKKQLVKGNEKE